MKMSKKKHDVIMWTERQKKSFPKEEKKKSIFAECVNQATYLLYKYIYIIIDVNNVTVVIVTRFTLLAVSLPQQNLLFRPKTLDKNL